MYEPHGFKPTSLTFFFSLGSQNQEPDIAATEIESSEERSCLHGSPVKKKQKLVQSSDSLGDKPLRPTVTKKQRTSTATSKNIDQLQTKGKQKLPEVVSKTSYSVEGVLSNWNETTDYGKSFRAMNVEGQLAEVDVLNKGAAKDMKGLIKKKLLIVHYKQLVADKMKQYISDSKVTQDSMFHATPKAGTLFTARALYERLGPTGISRHE